MRKYKNVSGQNVGFLLDGKTYDFQNNEVVLVPDNFAERVQGIVAKIVPMEEPRPVQVIVQAPVVAVPKKPKYTEKELYAMTKAKQVSILKSLGESAPSTEKARVAKILELSK